ncbi:MAG: hypothetical protein IPI28_19000 [Candidatus Omnitrophica bacterium]|nr:hypothetical protein [Candidatus Omnitrophota bacterium]
MQPTSKPLDPDLKQTWGPLWFRKFVEKTLWHKDEIEFRKQELREMLKKAQEREEEMEMVKKLARVQVEEVAGLYEKNAHLEQLYTETKTELDLLKTGTLPQEGEIKALSVIKMLNAENGNKETWAPVIFTLSNDGTKVLKREGSPDTERRYALDNGKIKFVELFEDSEAN